MPVNKNEFSYEIKQGQPVYDDFCGRQDFFTKKPDGYRGFEKHHKPRQSKSNPQLGYYWGLLIPEIVKQLEKDEITISTSFEGRIVERYYDRDDTHKMLKGYCAKVGNDGVFVTLSEQDQELCSRYIDHVV